MDITITLGDAEIEEAIKDYVTLNTKLDIEGELEVNLVAGKGAAGNAAVVKIVDKEAAEAAKPKTKAKPKATKSAAKDVTPEVKEEPKKEEAPVSEGLKAATAEPGDDLFGNLDTPAPDATNNDEALQALFGS